MEENRLGCEKKCYINNLLIPQKLLEIIRDDEWNNLANRDTKDRHNFFPNFVFTFNSLTFYAQSLVKAGVSLNGLDLDKIICIGELEEDLILLDYRNFPFKPPSVYSLFRSNVKIATYSGHLVPPFPA